MIEVEKKFLLTEEEKQRLLKDAQFLVEKVFTDVYYDTSDWSLTRKDVWLRRRGNNYELKVPVNYDIYSKGHVLDQYREFETVEGITEFLNLFIPKGSSLEEILEKAGYKTFCTLTTTRKKYIKDGYNIYLDYVDFGYTIAEIELMVSDESEVSKATDNILDFAKSHGMSISKVRGKVAEFLSRYSPVHFEVLQKAGVFY